MESSIVLLLRILNRIERAKKGNAKFGTIVDLTAVLDCLASTARFRINRHAFRVLGVQS